MRENTNKAIAFNSLVLYAKMAVTTVCALLTTRFGLQALGVVDYGLFALLGGIVSMISVLNNIFVSTSNRFIAVALGKGKNEDANYQFNVNLTLHITIALIVLTIAYPVGYWYIHHFVNYDGPLSNAMMVYCISILGSAVSFVKVPYTGLLMAKERFVVFSAVDVLEHIVKMVVAWLLLSHFSHKLLIYTLSFALIQPVSTLFFIIYCGIKYPSIVSLRRVKDRAIYKNVFHFSAWIGVGAVAHSVKNQGASVVVNSMFNTVMNSAMGVASSINGYIILFAQNITQPMAPQITKSYAAGDKSRTDDLLVMSTKYSYLFTLVAGSLFLAEPEWIMRLWLGEVPPFATSFLILFIIDSLILSANAGIQNIIFASGKLGLYQSVSSILNIASIVLGYFVLREGAPAYYLVISFIIVSVIRFFSIQWALHRTLDYDNSILWKRSYLPSLAVSVLYVPALFIPHFFHPIVKIIITLVYLCFLVFFVGLSREERSRLIQFVNSLLVIKK